jgi:hypothetical protein
MNPRMEHPRKDTLGRGTPSRCVMLCFGVMGLLLTHCAGSADPRLPGGADNSGMLNVKAPLTENSDGVMPEACNGVSERGTCYAGEAIFCDLSVRRLLRINCKALGKDCVVDPEKGAQCAMPPEAVDACQGITEDGQCNGSTLQYCYDGELETSECSDYPGYACQVDTCYPGGAACCPAS